MEPASSAADSEYTRRAERPLDVGAWCQVAKTAAAKVKDSSMSPVAPEEMNGGGGGGGSFFAIK